MSDIDLKLKYFGCVGLLAECAVYVDEETRESIEQAIKGSGIKYKRIIDRFELYPEGFYESK